MERYVCVHGHFYQPPRENPSLEAVEIQDSAYPFHDWNERVTAECYAPNGASRILNGEGRIIGITNNYERISFDFGPTLLAWMERMAPETYQTILETDRRSVDTFSGHGSCMGQAYNHMIMPLANQRDKFTQVIWGIKDFEHRFGRRPEGMWLPETAVDLETLDILAEQGVVFTILAQHQASRVRKIGDRAWRDISGGRIDPSRAYQLRLPSGRRIVLFFYDGAVSRAVAFEGLLDKGENLAGRLAGAFSDARSWPQLVHIATDGESYGHHHRFGDMALAYALHHLESSDIARLTNYGEFLEKHPPTHEVEIIENSAWSCAHGLERWRSDCGCNSGGYPAWNQSWRAPLRQALDWLRDTIVPRYEKRSRRLLKDPWQARNDYISIVLDRSPDNVNSFLEQHSARRLTQAEKVTVLKLLEIQRHAMLMYTSCGWFFDEISGIETVQVLQYAGRVIQLAMEVLSDSVEAQFLDLVELAKSNIPEYGDGRRIYERWVKPALTDLERVGTHYAISSLFEDYDDVTQLFCYTVEREDYRLLPAGRVRLGLGSVRITSQVTHDSKMLSFGVLHLGDHNLSGGVREYDGKEAYETLGKQIADVFYGPDLAGLIRLVDKNFGSNSYSLSLLFRDQQRRIMGTILDSTMGDAEAVYNHVYEHHAPVMRFLTDANAPLPKAWHAAAELVINSRLRRVLEDENLDWDNAAALLDEARKWQITLDGPWLSYVLQRNLERAMIRLSENPFDIVLVRKLESVMAVVRSLPFGVNLWKVQNIYYSLLNTAPRTIERRNDNALEWLHHFAALGEMLGVEVSEMNENQFGKATAIEAEIERIALRRRIPSATYRLQFNGDFTFRDAQALAAYLDDLGISDCYASPLFKARANSRHGYDISDHSQLNPALGSYDSFESFSAELQARGMGLIMDIVPNHMAVDEPSNVWWMDVLENGPSSIYASYFDIDWQPVKRELQNKVVLPILEDQYGKVLERGQLRLSYEDGSFFVSYYNFKLPVAPRTYSEILSYQLNTLVQALGEDSEYVRELRSILTALSYLPLQTDLDPEKIEERNREKEVIKNRLSSLYKANGYVRAAIDMAVQAFNGVEGNPRSFDMLDHLLERQSYRPSFWRVAAEEINYRRFFDVNELAAIRVELPQVFDLTHKLVLHLLTEEKVTGLRIDHPDGLWDPGSYFRQLHEDYLVGRLRSHMGLTVSDDSVRGAVSGWLSGQLRQNSAAAPIWPLFVIAEKILADGESLHEDWMVDGTTGYDFLNAANGLFIDGRNRKAFDRIYGNFIGTESKFRNLTNSAKKMIMLVSLVSEINAIGHQLERTAEKNRLFRDFTLNSLTFAIREIIAALPVYRTYVAGLDSVTRQDQAYIEAAVVEAKKRNPRTAASVFDFIQDTLLLRNINDFAEPDRQSLVDLVMKFQQITGPVTAKGVEDTAFYVYNRLVSLNEVGGHPERFGVSVEEFHRQNAERSRRWPHSLLATSTHDTKRSEDVRARINILSEMPSEWSSALARWRRLNASKKTSVNGDLFPEANDEYLLYQTLLGTWPDDPMTAEEFLAYRERIIAYMQKATKEAKIHTSWVNPNEEYDSAVRDFVQGLLPESGDDPFLEEMRALQSYVAYYGRHNALSQALLKLTAPGVPDIYQGNELWDYSLVDPDNRRPVDFERRRRLLTEMRERRNREGEEHVALPRELVESSRDGRIKLYVIHQTLSFRRSHQQLFANGSYLPLTVRGAKRDHAIAFARASGEEEVLVIAPRLIVGLTDGKQQPLLGPDVWRDTLLVLSRDHAHRRYRNVFTGEVLSVSERGGVGLLLAEVFANFPVALLERLPG